MKVERTCYAQINGKWRICVKNDDVVSKISGKINAFHKIISERHLIWNAVLVNFRTLCNCYIIPNVFQDDRTFYSTNSRGVHALPLLPLHH